MSKVCFFKKLGLNCYYLVIFSLTSIFPFRTYALRQPQKDGCVKKKGKGLLIPLVSIVPFQQETLNAPWVLLATSLDRGTPSLVCTET